MTHAQLRSFNRLFPRSQQTFEESIVVSGIRADDETPVTKTDITRDDDRARLPRPGHPAPAARRAVDQRVRRVGRRRLGLLVHHAARRQSDAHQLHARRRAARRLRGHGDVLRRLPRPRALAADRSRCSAASARRRSARRRSAARSTSRASRSRRSSASTRDVGGRLVRQQVRPRVGWQSRRSARRLRALHARLVARGVGRLPRHRPASASATSSSARAKTNDDSQLRLTGFSGTRAHAAVVPRRRRRHAAARTCAPIRSRPDDKDSFGYDLAQLQYIRASRAHEHDRLRRTTSAATAGIALDGLTRYGLDGLLVGGDAHDEQDARRRSPRTTACTSNSSTAITRATSRRHARLLQLRHEGGGERLRQAQLRPRRAGISTATRSCAPPTSTTTATSPSIRSAGRSSIRSSARATTSRRQSSVYASAGISTREPTRNDLFQGEDNATFAHDLHAVQPERLFDLEAGWDSPPARTTSRRTCTPWSSTTRSPRPASSPTSACCCAATSTAATAAASSSRRRGRPRRALRLRANANLSRNRISTWTQFYDVYDDAGNFVESAPLDAPRRQPAAHAGGDRQPVRRLPPTRAPHPRRHRPLRRRSRISTTPTTPTSRRRRSSRSTASAAFALPPNAR